MLTCDVQTQRRTQEVMLRCEWRPNGSGGHQWDGATLHLDGRQRNTRIGWPEVNPLLASLATTMVDPGREAAGETRHGRTAQEWRSDAREQYEAVLKAYVRAAAVRDVLQERAGSGTAPVWVHTAQVSTRPLHERIVRRRNRVQEVWLRTADEVRRAEAEGRAADARRAFELTERARVLAEACTKDADAVEAAMLAEEAQAECEPYVAVHTAAMEAEEAAWRAEHPGGSVEAFAREVIQALEVPARDYARWWREDSRPGMTYWEGWDARRDGQTPHAETRAYLALGPETNLAVFALGKAAAAQLRAGGDPEQREKARTLEDAAARGEALYAPGAWRRIGEGDEAADRVWCLVIGRRHSGAFYSEARKTFAAVLPWCQGPTAAEGKRLRRLLLVDHALWLRRDEHAAERDRMTGEAEGRQKAANGAYEAAREAGEDEKSARLARRDALLRLEADAAGREADGRERFARGDAVWVEPDDEATRYVGRVVSYTAKGVFLVTGPAGREDRDAPAGRLSPASAEEAAADRTRQAEEAARRVQEEARREEEREVERAEARDRAALVEAERRLQDERFAARDQVAVGTAPPLCRDGKWQPVCAVPESVGELWAAAARYGWRMVCRTEGEGGWSRLLVTIAGTTDRGRWGFQLVWNVTGGRYSVSKPHSQAKWADGRSGPRGGVVRPTITDVLSVMRTETREGASASLGELVGGPGRAEKEAEASEAA